jgi:hypothetical protein
VNGQEWSRTVTFQKQKNHRICWKIINRARSPEKTSTIPDLIVLDKEKANLFRLSSGETFADGGPSTSFLDKNILV